MDFIFFSNNQTSLNRFSFYESKSINKIILKYLQMFVPRIASTFWFYHCTLEMSTVTWTQWAFSSENEGESNEQNLISCIKSDKLCKQRFNENLAMSKTAWRAAEKLSPKYWNQNYTRNVFVRVVYIWHVCGFAFRHMLLLLLLLLFSVFGWFSLAGSSYGWRTNVLPVFHVANFHANAWNWAYRRHKFIPGKKSLTHTYTSATP